MFVVIVAKRDIELSAKMVISRRIAAGFLIEQPRT